MDELFSENLQNGEYVQTNQLIIYKEQTKHNNLVSSCVSQ